MNISLPPNYGPDWNNQASRLHALHNLHFAPRTILDIGAYHGYWAGLAQWVWPKAEILSLEANDDCKEELTKRGRPFQIVALSDKSESKTYYKCETGCGEGNSFFKEDSIYPFKQVVVTTQTLEQIVKDKIYDLVKIDCQGAEAEIMRGGFDTIRCAQIVLLETQIQDYNPGAPRISDIIKTMKDEYNFRLYDIIDFHYNSRGLLIQADLMFAPEDSILFQIHPLT
jgi:FkbM family methyltransferase